MTEDAARARIAAQATREQRLAIADYVIDNSGPLEELSAQVDALWRELSAKAA
jgi:dephospho-CoA kinase